jgi:hypothetical protein
MTAQDDRNEVPRPGVYAIERVVYRILLRHLGTIATNSAKNGDGGDVPKTASLGKIFRKAEPKKHIRRWGGTTVANRIMATFFSPA